MPDAEKLIVYRAVADFADLIAQAKLAQEELKKLEDQQNKTLSGGGVGSSAAAAASAKTLADSVQQVSARTAEHAAAVQSDKVAQDANTASRAAATTAAATETKAVQGSSAAKDVETKSITGATAARAAETVSRKSAADAAATETKAVQGSSTAKDVETKSTQSQTAALTGSTKAIGDNVQANVANVSAVAAHADALDRENARLERNRQAIEKSGISVKQYNQTLRNLSGNLAKLSETSTSAGVMGIPSAGGGAPGAGSTGSATLPVSEMDKWLVEQNRLRNTGQLRDGGVGGVAVPSDLKPGSAPEGDLTKISGSFSGSDLLANVTTTSKANQDAFDKTFKTIEGDIESFSGSFNGADLLTHVTTISKANQEAFDKTFKTIEGDIEGFSGSFSSTDLLSKATTNSKAELDSFEKFYKDTQASVKKYADDLGNDTLDRFVPDLSGGGGGGGGSGGSGGSSGSRGGGGGGSNSALGSLLPGPTAAAPVVGAAAAAGAGALGGVALSTIPALFLAIGVAAEKSNTQVSSAFDQMLLAAKQTTTAGFEPMIPALVSVAKQATSTLGGLEPVFNQAAHAMTPLIEAVGAGFLQAAKQGIGAAVPILQSLGPLATAIGGGFVQVEQAIMGFFKNIDVGAAADGLKALGGLLQALAPDVGTLISALAPLGSVFLNITSLLLNGLEPALKTIAALVNIPGIPYLVAAFGALEVASKLLSGSWINFSSIMKTFKSDADSSTSTMSTLGQQFGVTAGAAKDAADKTLQHAASLAQLQKNADASAVSVANLAVDTARNADASQGSAKYVSDLDNALLSQRQATDKATQSAKDYESAAKAASEGSNTFSSALKGIAGGLAIGVALTAVDIVVQHFADNAARAAQYTADIQTAASATASVLGTYGSAVDAQSIAAEKAAIAGQDWVKVLTDEGLSLDTVAKASLNSLPDLLEVIKTSEEAAAAAEKKLDFQGATADFASILTIEKQYTQAQKDAAQATQDAATALLNVGPDLQKQAELLEAGTIRTDAQTAATAALAQGMTAGEATVQAYSAGVLAMGSAYLAAIKPSEDLATAQQTLQSSMNAIVDTERTNATAAASAYQAWQSAINGVTTAQNSLVTAQQGVAAAQHAQTEAAYTSQQAQVSYTQSVTAEALAETNLGLAQKAAAQNLIDLGLQLKDQADSQASAELKLYNAQVAVNNAGLAHTTLSLNDLNVAGKVNTSNESQYQLLLNLSEAQNALNDTQNTGAQLTATNNLAVSQGVEGAPSVVAAHLSVTDAQAQVAASAKAMTDAQYAQQQAVDATKQAVFNLSQQQIALKTAQNNVTTAQNTNAQAQLPLQAKIGGTSDASIALNTQVTNMFNAYAALHSQDPNLIADFEQQYQTITGSKGPVAGLDAWLQRLTGNGGLNGIVANYSVVGTPSLNLNNIITQAQALGISPSSLGFSSAQIQGAQISAGNPTATAGGTVNAQVPGGATGGQIGGVSPSNTADNIPLWVTAREWIHPVDAVDYYGPEVMAAVQKRQIPKELFTFAKAAAQGWDGAAITRALQAPGMAAGGSVGTVQSWLQNVAGSKPYVWGGVGPDSYDCSGLVGEVYNQLRGLPSDHRVFTTSNEEQFFTPGKGTFTVGINPGVHTAGNLGGLAFEAASPTSGIHIGASAQSVDNFPVVMYLPLEGSTFTPGGSGVGSGVGSGPSVADARKLWGANFKEAAAQVMGQTVIDTMKSMGASNIPRGLAPSNANAQIDFGAFVPSVGGGAAGPIPTGQHRAIIDAALAADSVPANQWPAWEAGMNTLIQRESSWNPNAINLTDANARAGHPSEGLAQMIAGTFEANRNRSLPDNVLDPEANVAAAINYIDTRYGGIGNVQQANPNLPPKGYALGGQVFDPSMLYAGLSTSMPKFAAGGQAVMPPVAASNPLTVGKSGLTIDGNITVNNPVREPSAKSLRRKLELFATLGERG